MVVALYHVLVLSSPSFPLFNSNLAAYILLGVITMVQVRLVIQSFKRNLVYGATTLGFYATTLQWVFKILLWPKTLQQFYPLFAGK